MNGATPGWSRPTARQALAALLPGCRCGSSPALVAERRHRLGNGPLVVTGQALDDPHTADKLTELALAGVRLLRLRDYYERKLRRVMLDDLDDTWFLFDRPCDAGPSTVPSRRPSTCSPAWSAACWRCSSRR